MHLKAITVFFLLLAAPLLHAQPHDGKYRERYANGKTHIRGHYKKGMKNGAWNYYDEQGRLQKSIHYEMDRLNGSYEEFVYDSALTRKGSFLFDQRDGSWMTFPLNAKGKAQKMKPLSVENYAKGLRDGSQRYWYANGKQKKECNYKGGVLNGAYAEWFETGEPKCSGSYSNTLLVGEWSYWSDSTGHPLDSNIQYSKGVRDGLCRYYYPDKTNKVVANFSEGQLNGEYQRYTSKDIKVFQTHYAMGVENGFHSEYTDDGKIALVESFQSGVLNGHIHSYSPKGDQPGFIGHYRDGKADSSWVFFYPGGVKMAEKKYAQSIPYGPYREYDEKGNLLQTGWFSGNLQDSTWTMYYPSGTKMAECHFERGNLKGSYRKWYESGTLMLEQVFPPTKSFSQPRVFDANGKALKPGTPEYQSIAFELPGTIYADVSAVDPYVQLKRAEALKNNDDNAPIVQYADVMPEFPGGMSACMTFLQKNIRYPQIERENGIQGRVFVNFVVERDGRITNVKVLRSVQGGSGLDKEAIRVVKAMPKWKPAIQSGRTVRCSMNLPIKFQLQ